MHAVGCLRQVRTGFSEKVAQEHLQLQTYCPRFDLNATTAYQRLPAISPLQDQTWCSCQFRSSGSTSKSLLIQTELQAMLLLSTNAELCRIANHQSCNWQCYLHWPDALHGKWFRTIQSQVMSKDDYSACGSGLCLHSVWTLLKSSKRILPLPTIPTEGLGVTLCLHGLPGLPAIGVPTVSERMAKWRKAEGAGMKAVLIAPFFCTLPLLPLQLSALGIVQKSPAGPDYSGITARVYLGCLTWRQFL